MNKFYNVLIGLLLGLSHVVCCTPYSAKASNGRPTGTVRFSIKAKTMHAGINRFMRPIIIEDQYYNVQDDDSYDSWEPAKLLRDSARLFAHTKTWGKSFDSAVLKSWYAPSRPLEQSIEPAVTWIGHSTFLIQLKKFNIITDPVFGSPSWFYTRSINPGIAANRLPRIDIILLSHNHDDHMDEESLLSLRVYQPLVMVPRGNAPWFKENGFNYVIEYTWWEDQEIVLKDDTSSIAITCVPAVHWSGRSLMDTNAALWSGWVITAGDQSIYFAGDTAYSKRQFEEIHALFPSITMALLPIGPNEPHNLVRSVLHMSAAQAVEAFLDLEAQWFIPMHWGTFRFGTDTFTSPTDSLKKAWLENSLQNDHLHILKFGQRLVYK